MHQSEMPKLQPLPITKKGEPRRWLLLEDWTCHILGRYNLFVIPAGFIFDGASIPRLFWGILSPTGYLFLAGLIHDFVYKYGFLYTYAVMVDGELGPIYKETMLDQKAADIIFEDIGYKICLDARVYTKIAFLSLRGFGRFTWKDYRKQDLKCDLKPLNYEVN